MTPIELGIGGWILTIITLGWYYQKKKVERIEVEMSEIKKDIKTILRKM